MSTEENKAITRRLNDEVWTKGRLEVIDELIADDFVTTVVGAPEQIRGPEGFRAFAAMYRTAFPDLRITVDEQIAEGETVVTRWTATGTHDGELMGIPATGKQATTAGVNINRISGGKLVEGWGLFDQLGLLQQLGAVPAPTRLANFLTCLRGAAHAAPPHLGVARPVAADDDEVPAVFGSIPQPAYMPCEECGASVPSGGRAEHVCSEQRRLEYRLFQLRGEIAAFSDQFTAYLDCPHGRFELWYAERERRFKRS